MKTEENKLGVMPVQSKEVIEELKTFKKKFNFLYDIINNLFDQLRPVMSDEFYGKDIPVVEQKKERMLTCLLSREINEIHAMADDLKDQVEEALKFLQI